LWANFYLDPAGLDEWNEDMQEMLSAKSSLFRGLLLVGIYVAAFLVLKPLHYPVALIVLLLAMMLFYFWVPGLLAEAAGLKPPQQFWFAFGSLGAFLGAISATVGVIRLWTIIWPIQRSLAYAIALSVVASTTNLGVLLVLFKFFVPASLVSYLRRLTIKG
jgi:hypothetical protein